MSARVGRRGATRALALALGLAAGATAGGCLDDVGVICEDGTTCPDDTSCRTVAGATYCASAAQVSACADTTDGAACEVAGQGGVCNDGVCLDAGCGDGFVSGAEQCDGDAFRQAGGVDETCTAYGFYRPDALRCLADCTIDFAACADAGFCGDELLEPDHGEECDTEAPADQDTCGEAGDGFYYDEADPVGCTTACRLDLAACDEYCGDGVVNGLEPCDGKQLSFDLDIRGAEAGGPDEVVDCRDVAAADVNGAELEGGERYFYGGEVACTPVCTLDLAACDGYCGDNVVDEGTDELCDGTDFDGKTCRLGGYYNGLLTCPDDCGAPTYERCVEYRGDGTRNGNEVCDCGDGNADGEWLANDGICVSIVSFLAGTSCESAGYYDGELGCNEFGTQVDYSACGGYCGDGVVDDAGDEGCDGFEQGDAPSTEGCSPTGGNGALGCSRFCQPAFDTCQDRGWDSEIADLAPAQMDQLGFIGGHAAGPRDLWLLARNAAGGLVVHYDGDDWVVPTTGPLMPTVISGRDDEVVIGDAAGFLWQPSGTNLLPIVGPPNGWPITGVAMTADGTLYAVTNAILYARDLAGMWAPVDGPTGVVGVTTLDDAVVAWNSSGAWIGGSGTWTAAPPLGLTVRTARVLSPDLVWLAGNSGTAPALRQWRVGAAALDTIAVPALGGGAQEQLRAIAGSSLGEMWLLGGRFDVTPATPQLYRFDGSTVTSYAGVTAPGGGATGTFALVSPHAGDLWVLGGEPRLVRYDGSGWLTSGAAAGEDVVDVAVTETSTWLVTAARVRQLHQRAAVGAATLFTDRAISAGTGRVVWANRDDDVWVFRESAGSTKVQRFSPTAGAETTIAGHVVLDAWGDGVRLVAVTSDALLEWDAGSGTWGVVKTGLGLGTTAAVWGGDAGVWMVGASGIWHEGDVAATSLPAGFTPHAVWATEGGDVWIAGQGVGAESTRGAIWRYDAARAPGAGGTRLADAMLAQQLPANLKGLRAIWGRSSTDVWAAGVGGDLVHWDGTSWVKVVHRQGTPGRDLLALHGLGGVAADTAMVALGGVETSLRMDHVLPGIGVAGLPEAAPLYCTEGSRVTRITIGDMGAPTWLRLEAPRDGSLELLVDADGPGLSDVGLAVYPADELGRPWLANGTGTSAASLSVPIQRGVSYFVAVAGSLADGTPAVPLDLQTSCIRD